MPRRLVRPECVHPAGTLYRGEIFMDWSTHKATSQPGPCRACGRPTTLTDCTGVRCHKVCAEREATRELATPPAPRAGPRRRTRGHLTLVGDR